MTTPDESYAWIVHADPKSFDVRAFASSPPDEWEWPADDRRIHPGQRVFLWSGEKNVDLPAGIFAEATTLTAPRFVAGDDPTNGLPGLHHVRLRLKRVAGKREVIKHDWWMGDPALSTHSDALLAALSRISDVAYRRLDRLWEKTGSDWTYEEAVGGLYAFVETLDRPVSKLPGSIVSDVALVIGRPVTGIYNKVMNFRALDPADPRKGFDGASDQDEAVWTTFFSPATGLDLEAVRDAYARLWGDQAASVPETPPPNPPRLQAAVGSKGLIFDCFREELAWLLQEIERVSATPFRSFREGLADDWEGYKMPLRAEALGRLGIDGWSEADIGSGDILECAIRAIEINGPGGLKNNLVGWQNQFGHASRSHKALLDARSDAANTAMLEQLFYDFYRSGLSEEPAFERFKAARIKSYDLNAYLFFLLDGDRYMPIRPTTFDPVLKRLGFDFSTTSRCSAENYRRFNDALREVQEALTTVAGLADTRLIDAHSFCWLLGRIDRAERTRAPARKPGASWIVYDARQRSIYMMVANAFSAAKAGDGRTVERTMKIKEVRMGQQELEAYVGRLIDKQEGRCALTGLPLQFHKAHDDEQLLASLDRIDSDGHYERGNLQVVCRFANQWKSDSHTDEFVRLLALVRGTP